MIKFIKDTFFFLETVIVPTRKFYLLGHFPQGMQWK